MTRDLTTAAAAQAASTATAPACILKIEFGGAVGARYYADHDLGQGDASSALNAQGRVASWGAISQVYREQTHNPIGDCRMVLHDADGALRGAFGDGEFQGSPVTIYQHFDGLAENDLQPILVGIVNAPVSWREADATCVFDITDVSTRYRRALGTLVTRDDLPYVAEADEGRVVPLVFGSVKRSPTVSCQGGAVTELVRDCSENDTYLYVNDASRFPQGQGVKIRIDGEIIEGQFAGNTFQVTARGADVVAGATVSAARDTLSFYDRDLSAIDAAYRGYFIKVTDPNGDVRYRQILRYSGGENCVEYFPRILLADGSAWTMPADTAYDITSWKRPHRRGAMVVLHDISYTFILNDAPSKAVRYIEGKGSFINWLPAGDDGDADWHINGGMQAGWSQLDPATYTVNTCDTSVYGAEHPVTTVTFGRHPAEFFPTVTAIHATLDGVETDGDGTGSLIEDPSEVIEEILTRFACVPGGAIDSGSFVQASADGAQFLGFSFVLDRLWDSLELVADLAMQARCALLWEDGRVRLQFLRNRMGSSALTLDTQKIVRDSLEIARTPVGEVVSEVRGTYPEQGELQTVVARDAAAESAYGRSVRRLDLWAYSRREHVEAVVSFWLERWKRPAERIRLEAYLPALALQRRDTVTLDWAEFFMPSQKGRVIDIEHRPGSGVAAAMDTIALTLELPLVAGCATICETTCETAAESGCFTACETAAQTCWQCETSCEDACELFCTTTAQTACISNDAGCGGACETGCQAHCESACELTCEVDCESFCECSCELTCETACESGCEVTCETACEITCETGCEATCEAGCETSCETGCETACQTLLELDCHVYDEFTRPDSSIVGGAWAELSWSGRTDFEIVDSQMVICSNSGGARMGRAANSEMAPDYDHGIRFDYTRPLDATASYHFYLGICCDAYTQYPLNMYQATVGFDQAVPESYRHLYKRIGGTWYWLASDSDVDGANGNGKWNLVYDDAQANSLSLWRTNGGSALEADDNDNDGYRYTMVEAYLAAQSGQVMKFDNYCQVRL